MPTPGVRHRHGDPVGRRPDPNLNPAALRELDGVGSQVEQDLVQPVRIRFDRQRL
jgi:hypothetical protein